MSQQRGAARLWWTQDREETVNELAGLENIGHRIGGAFIVTPIRQRVMDDQGQPVNDPSGAPLFQCVAWAFKHVPFMPAIDQSRGAPAPLAEDAPLTSEEMHQHFPDEPPAEVVAGVDEAEEAIRAQNTNSEDEPDIEAIRARLEAEGLQYETASPTEGLSPAEIATERDARAARAADPAGADTAGDAVVAAGARAQS